MKSICWKDCGSWLEEHKYIWTLIVRLGIGFVFLQSGLGKLRNLGQITEFFQTLGIPLAHIQAPFVASLEFVGGICIILGLGTRVFSGLLMFVMLVAILTATLPGAESKLEVFGSVELAYLFIFGMLVFDGGGGLALDAKLCKGKKKRKS